MPTAPRLPYQDDVSYTLSNKRRVNLFGTVGDDNYSHIENSLAYMAAKSNKTIDMFMHTPGGSVVAGLAIYDSIKRHGKKMPIDITVQGACMSMGIVILQAARNRYATPNSAFLLHKVSFGRHAQLDEQEDDIVQAQRTQATLDRIITERSGMKLADLQKLIKRKDYAISAEEALDLNLIDAIIE